LITPVLVWAVGASQLLCWGISYYLIAIFAGPISGETDWPLAVVDGGFSAALVVMGLVSPAIGSAIDRFGGRPVMSIESGLIAVACVLLSVARSLPPYYAAWLVLGIGMRMTLYDAAFAALARIGGPRRGNQFRKSRCSVDSPPRCFGHLGSSSSRCSAGA
jgi:MFS family permease